MSLNRQTKETLVEAFGESVKDAELLVVLQQNGLNAEETLNLRRDMRAENVTLKVAKNSLIKLAIKDTRLEGISSFLVGPTMIAFSKDPVAAAKVAAEFAKKTKNKLSILGAAFGEQVLDVEATMVLATLPSLDALRGKLVGILQAPATKFAVLAQAPAAQVARVLSAYSKKAA